MNTLRKIFSLPKTDPQQWSFFDAVKVVIAFMSMFAGLILAVVGVLSLLSMVFE